MIFIFVASICPQNEDITIQRIQELCVFVCVLVCVCVSVCSACVCVCVYAGHTYIYFFLIKVLCTKFSASMYVSNNSPSESLISMLRSVTPNDTPVLSETLVIKIENRLVASPFSSLLSKIPTSKQLRVANDVTLTSCSSFS